MAWVLLAIIAGLFGLGLKNQYVGIYGWVAHRQEHPTLYWGQMSVAALVMVLLLIIVMTGDT